ncbi:hypothetical protein HNY73_006211 [Argiope bruennichi]|uniref:Integrase catalytic domain-containing protein n=1 Tax=Argiope bruennichi TaxID=94029 RepID=A0A8T0FJ92_ARGBR|nr:hypothetical protein HNY73_006211 [Argiope bruennichi]
MTDQKTSGGQDPLRQLDFQLWSAGVHINGPRLNFGVHVFKAFTQFLGTHRTQTTIYHPQAIGMVERFRRQLKAAILCETTEKWTEILPVTLLGIYVPVKEDISASSAKMIFGFPTATSRTVFPRRKTFCYRRPSLFVTVPLTLTELLTPPDMTLTLRKILPPPVVARVLCEDGT